MRFRVKNKRDLLGGCVMALFGLVSVAEGCRLGMGSLAAMGPGYAPVWLGIILISLGLFLSIKQTEPSEGTEVILDRPQWIGWACIIAGVLSFIILGKYAGLVPASFACVFISALGDRSATVKSAAILSACITLLGVALFHFLLKVSIPLFWWQS